VPFLGFNWYTMTPPRWYIFSPALTKKKNRVFLLMMVLLVLFSFTLQEAGGLLLNGQGGDDALTDRPQTIRVDTGNMKDITKSKEKSTSDSVKGLVKDGQGQLVLPKNKK
jgi:hypothetical protein